MAGTRGRFAIGACAALLLCAFSAGAPAQSREQAIQQVQIGLERALKVPLEIAWLRAELRKEAWLALGPRGVARAERALHDDAVDPAAELESDRAQRTDAQKAVRGVQAYGSGVRAVADDGD